MMFSYNNKIPIRHRLAAGITLVEIALVVMIVGLLVIAILKHNEFIRIMYMRKIAAEVQSFGRAARTFEQKYDALPGDYADASETFAGCSTDGANNPTNPNFCRNGNGDGHIGRYCHFMWTECFQTGMQGAPVPSADVDGLAIPFNVPLETSMFWKHLFMADMIGSIIRPMANPINNPLWGDSHPAAAVTGAGYVVSGGGGFLGGYVTVNMLPTPTSNPNLIRAPGGDPGANKSLTLRDARYLDTKYDNGLPGSGALWWNPIGSNTANGCRRDDGSVQNTWETHISVLDKRNCNMTWAVY